MKEINITKKVFGVLAILFFVISCSDFTKKEIDIDTSDKTPKIVVSAILENDLFCIYLSLSTPIKTNGEQFSRVVKDAVVRLYEEDDLLFEATERDESFQHSYYDPEYAYLYPYAMQENIKVIPGKSYRLEIFLEGYPPVTSTVVAPEEPLVENLSLNISPLVEREYERTGYAENFGISYHAGCNTYFQMNLTLNDNSEQKDYYLIEVFETSLSDASIAELHMGFMGTQRQAVATTDRILIQDNPEVISNQWMSDPGINTFTFGQLILSDLSFQGKSKDLNLLVSTCNLSYKDDFCEYLEKIGHYDPSRIIRKTYRLLAIVKHICPESYDFYRTIASQSEDDDLGFLSEPAIIISNIEGGYGCFSVSSSKQVTLLTYEVCELSYY